VSINLLVLAYQGSRDGFEADKFHSTCDLKGESVTIIKSSDGYGYSSVSWDAKNKHSQYESAPGSFIFTISNPHGIPLSQHESKYAVNHCTKCGPIFG
jgi:hypothetical protein